MAETQEEPRFRFGSTEAEYYAILEKEWLANLPPEERARIERDKRDLAMSPREKREFAKEVERLNKWIASGGLEAAMKALNH